MFLHTDSKDSDQTGWMPRLIRVFAGRTGHVVGFVMWRLIWLFHEIQVRLKRKSVTFWMTSRQHSYNHRLISHGGCHGTLHVSYSMTKLKKWPVHPANTQISLGICPGWSESLLCAQWELRTQAFFMRTAKTDQTGWMPRLIPVFAGRTCHFVGSVMRQLISCSGIISRDVHRVMTFARQ